jgi:hypothetical protein
MQVERIQLCSKALMEKGCSGSWFVPLQIEASVQDILQQFASFIITGTNEQLQNFPLLETCFQTLLQETNECMFVFVRRYDPQVVGILRSTKPLLSPREQELVQIVENRSQPWNLPLWTWTDSDSKLVESMETQCCTQSVSGHCLGIWCYR